MRRFEFVAVGPDGATLRGRETAADEASLDRELERRGIVLVSARVSRADTGRMDVDELVAFTSQLAVTIEAGVPLLEALDGFARRARRAAARRVLERLAQSLRAGSSLSDAMERESASFPLVYRASIRAGEASGIGSGAWPTAKGSSTWKALPAPIPTKAARARRTRKKRRSNKRKRTAKPRRLLWKTRLPSRRDWWTSPTRLSANPNRSRPEPR